MRRGPFSSLNLDLRFETSAERQFRANLEGPLLRTLVVFAITYIIIVFASTYLSFSSSWSSGNGLDPCVWNVSLMSSVLSVVVSMVVMVLASLRLRF